MMKNKTNEPLKGQTFVFTGDMSVPRDEAKSKVLMLGGKSTIQPSSKTTYLVTGSEPGPSKVRKAVDLGIKIIKESEFSKLIDDCMRDFNDTFLVSIEPKNENVGAEKKNACNYKKASTENELKSSSGRNITNNKEAQNDKKLPDNKLEMLSEKYRPKRKEDLIGNKNVVSQLENFVLGKTKYKAALLSGQPGVGKTTATYVVCNSNGLKLIEFNASDVRNKSEITKKVKGLINNYSISSGAMQKAVLVMDEIDGMTSDRGGLSELHNMIKKTKIPIVCICNDRTNQKIRILASSCLDLRFRKLEAVQILPRLKYILQKEKKHVSDNMLREILLVSNGDVRYTLNVIQNLVLREKLDYRQVGEFMKKSALKGIFDVVAEMFHKNSINEKTNLYFEDYSMVPLFVAENYLKLNYVSLHELYNSCQSISMGDVVEKHIRGSNQDYSLLPLHAFYSSIYPTRTKILNKRIDFPVWLGQNSKGIKNDKWMTDVQKHSSIHFHMNKEVLRLYGANLLAFHYLRSLEGGDIEKGIGILEKYDLLKEDMGNLLEVIDGASDRFKSIKPKTKSELTRQYKKLKRSLPYNVVEERRTAISDEEQDIEQETS